MKYTGPYTEVIYEHYKGQHRTDGCWHLHSEKKLYRRYSRDGSSAQKKTTEKEINIRSKAYSAVAAVAYAEGWLLDSAASFYIAREEPDDVNKLRGGKKIRTVNS
jgi:hypothetical protein